MKWINLERSMFLNRLSILFIMCGGIFFSTCSGENETYSSEEIKVNYSEKVITEDPDEARKRAREIRENTAIVLADGLEVRLWGSDSLAPDPVAMSIDDRGHVYLTRTNRQKNSEFDIRGHMHWVPPSSKFESVEDRRFFLKKTFSPYRSKANDWMKDLNGDGMKDWRDLAVEKEEVWRLEDRSGDTIADRSTRILNDFHTEVTDVAGALLVRENDMFVGAGPDMWRLQDLDGDRKYDVKTSISHGYAIHIGFSGHGMSGAIQGPDGKIYWGIGDIGVNIVSQEGEQFFYPNEGVIVRSNPDGSDFEVFAHGLRNTHEFVFDKYGNIITSDNDGDHAGESERIVYIIDGHDAGWRSNWQFGKYTDSKNNAYKVWMDEKMYLPHWEGQAAYFIPPIRSYHSGPVGMAYNPGAALGSEWQNTFFVGEFTGTPARSHIWAFKLNPKGASFEFAGERDFMSGVLQTAIRFGPDGALYVADWINGWDTKNYGRVWRVDVKPSHNDLADLRIRTRELMTADYSAMPPADLTELLAFPDMRIRQKAQLALVNRDSIAVEIFEDIAANSTNELARIHSIWGLGQLIRSGKDVPSMVELLSDKNPEIIAQVCRVIGDEEILGAADKVMPLVSHPSERVQFFAVQALGRLKHAPATDPIIEMIRRNNNSDLYLRYAGALALSRIGNVEKIRSLESDDSQAVRLAAVLVLRKLQDPAIVEFLDDSDEYIVTEAARAINDDYSIEEALPALAGMLAENKYSNEALLRRAISAALRNGTSEDVRLLVNFALDRSRAAELRAEALDVLTTWAAPSWYDRVDSRYRGEIERDVTPVREEIMPHMSVLMDDSNPLIVQSAIELSANLGLKDVNDQLVAKLSTAQSPEVRKAALAALKKLRYENMSSAIRSGMTDESKEVRSAAVSLLGSVKIDPADLPEIVRQVFSSGTISEQQQMISVMKDFNPTETEPIMNDLMDRLEGGEVPNELKLELFDLLQSSSLREIKTRLAVYRNMADEKDAAYAETLYGGDFATGRNYFMNNPTGQCIRCHAINGEGGQVGPDLSNIGNVLSREKILESLINPSARLAPGYGTVSLTLKDGSEVTGILMEEEADRLIIKTTQAEPLEISRARIATRQNFPSGMPAMGEQMTKREIRDIIEFLASQKP